MAGFESASGSIILRVLIGVGERLTVDRAIPKGDATEFGLGGQEPYDLLVNTVFSDKLMEQRVRNQQGYPAGSFLSDFALPDLGGRIVRVSDLVGQSYLLVFVGQSCDPSAEVMRYLSTLPATCLEDHWVIVVCAGGIETARTMANQYELRMPVIAQVEDELLHFMRVPATPAAYNVDANRTTIGPLAIGADAVITLLPAVMTMVVPLPSAANETPRATTVTSNPYPLRNGLQVGESAPEIEMQSITGEFASLSADRGRWTLLVFWAPDCLPCNEVVSSLAKAGTDAPGLALMVIGKGEEHQYIELAELLGPNVLIGLQQHRMIARQYQAFDTPAAYLIDPAGRIAEPLAKGIQAVLRLVQKAIARAETTPA